MSFFVRLAIGIVFGFIGLFVARFGPLEFFGFFGTYFLAVAFLAFGILGFILPEIIELAGKAGITALAVQIGKYVPNPPDPINVGPFKRNGRKQSKYLNPIIVDTSALIDGRILDVVKSGFLFGTLVVIPSVISELHKLADNSHDLRRVRGRRGLDILSKIQKEKWVKIEIVKTEPKEEEVDSKLVSLAKKIKGKVLTVDFNLNKVAKVNRVKVLNLNELANAVKTAVLPGEQLSIHINDKGKEKDQGIGYLSDGTMVVVEGGADLVGKTAEVLVHRVLQTEAGKMIFARRAN